MNSTGKKTLAAMRAKKTAQAQHTPVQLPELPKQELTRPEAWQIFCRTAAGQQYHPTSTKEMHSTPLKQRKPLITPGAPAKRKMLELRGGDADHFSLCQVCGCELDPEREDPENNTYCAGCNGEGSEGEEVDLEEDEDLEP